MFTSIKCNRNPKIVQEFNLSNSVDENGGNHFNFLLNFNVTIVNATTLFDCKMKSDPKSSNYDQQIIKTSINACRIVEGINSNFLIKLFLESMNSGDKGNYILKCPFGPTKYELQNIRFDDKNVPKMFLFHDFHFRCDVQSKVKVQNTKIYVPYWSFTLIAHVTKNN